MGIPGYPFVSLEHPLGSCTEQEIRDKARIAADQLLSILQN
jgi:hypothetical protein